MNWLVVYFLIASLATLGCGFQSWRLTSSRSCVASSLVGSFGLLLAAFALQVNGVSELIAVVPFFVAMLFAGRGAALLWRSRRESVLRVPGALATTNAALSLVGAIFIFLSQ